MVHAWNTQHIRIKYVDTATGKEGYLQHDVLPSLILLFLSISLLWRHVVIRDCNHGMITGSWTIFQSRNPRIEPHSVTGFRISGLLLCIYLICFVLFTARRSCASAVLGVVILSVCLSHACFVTNAKNLPSIFLYHMKWKILLVFCHPTVVGGQRALVVHPHPPFPADNAFSLEKKTPARR